MLLSPVGRPASLSASTYNAAAVPMQHQAATDPGINIPNTNFAPSVRSPIIQLFFPVVSKRPRRHLRNRICLLFVGQVQLLAHRMKLGPHFLEIARNARKSKAPRAAVIPPPAGRQYPSSPARVRESSIPRYLRRPAQFCLRESIAQYIKTTPASDTSLPVRFCRRVHTSA